MTDLIFWSSIITADGDVLCRGHEPACSVAQSCPTLCDSMDRSHGVVPLSKEFSGQEYWSGLPCPTPGGLPNLEIKPTSLASPALEGGFFITEPPWKPNCSLCLNAAAAAAKSLQSCPTLCDPTDRSPPGSPVPGILQARTLEWVAISFSNAWKWKVKVKSLSRVWLFTTPWTATYQGPPSMGFSRQEYWSGVPLPSPVFKCPLLNFMLLFLSLPSLEVSKHPNSMNQNKSIPYNSASVTKLKAKEAARCLP